MCFRILSIIRRWAELILAPLRCRSKAKALPWSHIYKVHTYTYNRTHTLSSFNLKPLHLRRKRFKRKPQEDYRMQIVPETPRYTLTYPSPTTPAITIKQIINIYRDLYPLTSTLARSNRCFFFSLLLIPSAGRSFSAKINFCFLCTNHGIRFIVPLRFLMYKRTSN